MTHEESIRAAYDAWSRRDIDGEMFHVIEIRDGLIGRLDAFRDRTAALDAFEAT
jgi:ketosteroid isomerase-like protein